MKIDKVKALNSITSSEHLRTYLFLKAKNVHKEFGIANAGIVLDNEPRKPEYVAYTDNSNYHINIGNISFYDGLSQDEIFGIRNGLLMHEIGHRIFTSFTAINTWTAAIENGRFYPEEPSCSGKEKDSLLEIKSFLENKKGAKILSDVLCLQLMNVLEDGREEELVLDYCHRHRALYQGLLSARKHDFEKAPPFSKLLEVYQNEEDKKLSVILQLIVFYARFMNIKDIGDDEYKTELYNIFTEIMPYIDDYLEARTNIEMCRSMNRILISIWPHIKELFKMPEDKEKSSDSSGSDEEDGEERSEEESKETDPHDFSKIPDAALESFKNDLLSAASVLPDALDMSLTGDGTDSKDLRSKLDLLPYERTDSITTDGSGKMTYEDREGRRDAKIDLESMLRVIGKEIDDEEKEEMLRKDIESFSSFIDFPAIHKSADCKIVRESVSEDEKAIYKKVSESLRKIAEIMARKSVFLEDETGDNEVKNRYSGTRLNPPAFAREDYKIFKKTVHNAPSKDLVVGVLVDESGSMSCNERDEAARRAAIVLYEYCDILNIPVCIYGHSTEGRCVEMYMYADFGRKDPNDRCRLLNIHARSENRDGYALRFMMERMKKEDANDKLLFVISDGQPCDSGYYGTAANKDLSEVAKECEKAGIFVIAAAIGSDKPQIKAIYGENHFLDISDLNKLPQTLVKLIKARIKK